MIRGSIQRKVKRDNVVSMYLIKRVGTEEI